MTTSGLKSKLDFWLIGLLVVLGVSISMVVNLVASGQASAFTINQTAPQRYYSPIASADGCYSNLNAVSNLAGPFGSGQWGLVNAIMNIPVYDWDQGTGPALYRATNLINPKGSLRGDVLGKGQAVGYVKDFNFTETPVPNPYWVGEWLMNPTPPFVAKNGDYVANPLVYQQVAAIRSDGMPMPALLGGGDPAPSGGDTGLYEDGLGGADSMEDIYNGNNNGQNQGDNADELEGEYTPGNLQDPDYIGRLVTGALGFASQSFGVRGDRPTDNCYETAGGDGYSAPSYAFSVINLAVPMTIPGWAYSLITIFDGKSISSSGVTFYLGGTVNNKFILDCYGRGKQPIVVPATYDLLDPRAYSPSQLGSMGANAAMALALSMSPPLAIVFGVPIPNLGALRGVPAIRTAFENYFYGFAFAFKVKPNETFNLPDYLDRRVIDMSKSKFFDVNPAVLAANPAICGEDYHGCSQNGAQFNPDVFVSLKEPYVLNADIEYSTADYHRTPDGQSIQVSVDGIKNGFDRDPYEPYPMSETDSSRAGGPTYNDNAGPGGEAFTRASVYRIEMKPGVVPNAIDIDKLDTSQPDWQDHTAYRGDPATSNPCSFFRSQLENGDGRARPSQVPDEDTPPNDSTNSNRHRPAFQDDDAYDCQRVTTQNVRMDTGEHRRALYTRTEKIDAETPPGTKICYAVYYDHYTNDIKHAGTPWWRSGASIDNYNSEYATPDDTSYLSRARCIVAGYKPSFQVRGGDLIVGENIYTNTNLKDVLAREKPDGSYDKRIFGSWTEYGAMAGGVIKHLGTGSAYRLGMPQSLTDNGPLTFSNDRDPIDVSLHNFGNYTDPVEDGFSKIANRFSQASGTARTINDTTINLRELDSGNYKIPAGATVDIVSENSAGDVASIGDEKSIILLAGDGAVLNIRTNIRIPTEYQSAGDISQVVIASENPDNQYAINIQDRVRQVDAWLINQKGSINTCWIRGANPPNDYRLIPRSLGPCDNTLYINGPVAAETIYLRRNGGKDQSSDPTQLHQSVAGEVFNLRPDAYIWASNHVNSSNKKYITTHVLDLPPRY